MKIVFHGSNALTFRDGFENLLDGQNEILTVSDELTAAGEAEAYATADVVIGVVRNAGHPPLSARLYHAPSAGYDKIELASLPEGTALCNCFGHEAAIAEYVFAALLARHVPLAEADAQLRDRNWHYWAGGPSGLRTELGSQTIGIVGFGHIGKTIAARAQAFGMKVHVANRSAVEAAGITVWSLDDLPQMMAKVDIVLNALPLTENTEGLIGAAALAAMPSHGIVVNVGRGPVIDEDALFDALELRQIGGAILDTWYVYPSADTPNPFPAHRPFHMLDNVMMTPHMSGWTHGTIARRQATMADNINRMMRGEPLVNQLK